MSISSELPLFRCISGTELDEKIEKSVYNKKKKEAIALYRENQRNTEQ